MTTPDQLEREHTLLTAAARYDALRTRDALAGAMEEFGTLAEFGTLEHDAPGRDEALEMLALGEVLARKAAYGRQLGVRRARAAGASWSQIGAALGTTKQSAWEAHTRWIEDQTAAHMTNGFEGFDETDAAAARRLAGAPDS